MRAGRGRFGAPFSLASLLTLLTAGGILGSERGYYGPNVCVPLNARVEALMARVLLFADGASWEVIKVK